MIIIRKGKQDQIETVDNNEGLLKSIKYGIKE